MFSEENKPEGEEPAQDETMEAPVQEEDLHKYANLG